LGQNKGREGNSEEKKGKTKTEGLAALRSSLSRSM
jgi:hypothetical protein